MLHFNYHIGELFYGVDITKEDANGTVPIGTHTYTKHILSPSNYMGNCSNFNR